MKKMPQSIFSLHLHLFFSEIHNGDRLIPELLISLGKDGALLFPLMTGTNCGEVR